MTELEQRGQRLKMLLKHYGLKQTILAQRLRVTRGYVSKMVGGTEPITHNMYDRLSNMFPLLNINWLMRGEGEMLLPREGQASELRPAPEEPPGETAMTPDHVFDTLRDLLEYYRERIDNLEKRVSKLEGRVKG